MLKKVQRRALGLVSNMRGRTYEDRLTEVGLTSLVDRRVSEGLGRGRQQEPIPSEHRQSGPGWISGGTAHLHDRGEGDGKKLPLTFEGWMMFR